MSQVTFRVSLAAIGLSVAVLAMPAYGAEPVRSIRYADLNLTTEAGAATLERRISSAAISICGPNEVRRVDLIDSWNRCYNATVASATRSVNEAIALARRGKAEQVASVTGAGSTIAAR
jgi:UrcA family protein